MMRLLLLFLLNSTLSFFTTASTTNSPPQLWGVPKNSTSTATNSSSIPLWKQRLPPPLNQRATLQRILIPTTPGCHTQVYLLGTSHVSNDSSADVQLLLETIHPDVVFLELCEQRTGMLERTSNVTENFDKNTSFWQKVAVVQQSEGMTRASALGTVLLTEVQHDYADSLGVELGSEFQVAHEYCLCNMPIICILGDRPLQLTLLRAWESLRWWGKTRVVLGLLWNCVKRQDPEELREWMQKILMEGETDVLTESIQELKQHFPSLERVIIQERDAYMACKLYQSCRFLPRDKNHTVCAIVGAGHVPGIVTWLTQPSNQTPEEILTPLVTTKRWKDQDVSPYVTDVTQMIIRHGV